MVRRVDPDAPDRDAGTLGDVGDPSMLGSRPRVVRQLPGRLVRDPGHRPFRARVEPGPPSRAGRLLDRVPVPKRRDELGGIVEQARIGVSERNAAILVDAAVRVDEPCRSAKLCALSWPSSRPAGCACSRAHRRSAAVPGPSEESASSGDLRCRAVDTCGSRGARPSSWRSRRSSSRRLAQALRPVRGGLATEAAAVPRTARSPASPAPP